MENRREFSHEENQEQEKPPFLYHGSPNKNIETLEPKNKKVRDENEGPVVFATQELDLASIFLAKGVVESGKFNNVAYAIIVDTKENYIKNDQGGRIYLVPSDSFENNPDIGLGKYEWTSKEAVFPSSTIEYPSALQAMLENKVQVYFIDQETYKKIQESDDDGLSILKNLESENQKTGINFLNLED